MDVRPLHIICFSTKPGQGCEPANFGLCRYPGEVSDPGFGRHQTKLKCWSWHSFCKTHYASDPRCGGLPNFLRCHLGVVALLDEAEKLGILGKVSDEGDFWETRSLERLTKEIGEQSAMLAGLLGVFKDALGQAPGAGTLEAPIAGYPNFEHLEAEGQRLWSARLSCRSPLSRSFGCLRLFATGMGRWELEVCCSDSSAESSLVCLRWEFMSFRARFWFHS